MREVSTFPPLDSSQETSRPTSHRRRPRDDRSKGLGDPSVRRKLVLLAVVPATLVSVFWVAASLLLFHGSVSTVKRSLGVLVLVCALVLVCGVVLGAVLFASAQDRAIAVRVSARQAALSRFAVRGHSRVAEVLHRAVLEQPPLQHQTEALPTSFGPALDSHFREIAAAMRDAETAALELAVLFHHRPDPTARPLTGQSAQGNELPHPVARLEPSVERHPVGAPYQEPGGSPEQFEVFANLSHRLQSLVHREIGLLDELENEIEDPDLLKSIFQVDHLATRIRRYAENLAVLGGAASSRQWTRSISIGDVLRSAVAEVEQYARVQLVPPLEGTVRGHAVVDIVHLLAELVENATMFSAPETHVLMRVQRVTAGLAIEVEDRGLGMEAAERTELNRLLSDPREFVLGERLLDGRIGLYVVSSLASRHNVSIQLQSNIYGGTQAVLVLPHTIQGEGPTDEARQPRMATQPEEAEQLPSPPQQDQGPAVRPSLPTRRSQGTGTDLPTPAPSQPTPPAGPPTVPRGDRPASPGPRPGLPTRVRQASLAPELRRDPAAEDPVPDTVHHDPGLITAFLAGARRAEDDVKVNEDHLGTGEEGDHGE